MSSNSGSGSPLRLSLWERLLAWYWGWALQFPLPSSTASSVTLDADEEPVREVSAEVARTLARLDVIAEAIIAGKIKGFVVFAEIDGEISRIWRHPDGSNHELMALSIKDYGHEFHLNVVRSQGNAPPQNRSEQAQ